MKTKFILQIALIAAFSSTLILGCQKEPHLNVTGTVENTIDGKIYLKKYDNKSFFTIDSATVSNGSFSFNTTAKIPEIYGISLIGSDEDPFVSYLVFLDENPTTIHLDTTNNFKNTTVQGSKEHDLYLEFRSRRDKSIREIIQEHPSSLAALYELYRYYSFRLPVDELKENIALFDPSLQSSDYVKVLKELAETIENTEVGRKVSDFGAKNLDGASENLYDHLGNGYVLIDFWASWCAPCRKESPYLVKAYEKYKEKGFEIIGVSLDNTESPWKKAIEKDGLNWIQFIDKDAWAGEGVVKFGVRLIPANFLLDKNGVIIAKNLKGDDIEKKLSELLK